jgi:hypothetical protein
MLDVAHHFTPKSISDVAFLLVLCTHQANYLRAFEQDKDSLAQMAKTLERVLYPAVDVLCRNGATVRPETRNYFQRPYNDPRLQKRLRDLDTGPASVKAA